MYTIGKYDFEFLIPSVVKRLQVLEYVRKYSCSFPPQFTKAL